LKISDQLKLKETFKKVTISNQTYIVGNVLASKFGAAMFSNQKKEKREKF